MKRTYLRNFAVTLAVALGGSAASASLPTTPAIEQSAVQESSPMLVLEPADLQTPEVAAHSSHSSHASHASHASHCSGYSYC